jgi:hypothetical protein
MPISSSKGGQAISGSNLRIGSFEDLIAGQRARQGRKSRKYGREADKYRSWSPYDESGASAKEKARQAQLGVSGVPDSFYTKVLEDARRNAELSQQEMRAAGESQTAAAEAYGEHHNELKQYINSQNEQHIQSMEARRQEQIEAARRDMQMQGMSQQAADQVVRGIEAGYAKQKQSAMRQQKLQELQIGSTLDAQALGAKGASLDKRARGLQTEMAMADAPSAILKQIEAAREDENRAIGSSTLDYRKAIVNSYNDAARAKETRRQADLGYYQGLQENAIQMDLAYAGLGSNTANTLMLNKKARDKYVREHTGLRIVGTGSGTPNPVPWTDVAPGYTGMGGKSSPFAAQPQNSAQAAMKAGIAGARAPGGY